ncbi:DUF4833 domain-containing protein [Psychromarinibacter sp. S121]|uniref:DUF4833 domain-containing protein n=1 Tax=Psychromarinibacter sp. S121 TaxID=3415127 RepID=UPI003C7E26CB
MDRRHFIGTTGAALAAASLPGAASAARLQTIRVDRQPRLPLVQPDWPVPEDPNQMFFLQRSTNENTIVFAARYDAAGTLTYPDAVSIYWRRYADDGERKPLKPIERLLAFGVNISRRATAGQFNVALKPLPQLSMVLLQTGPFKAQVLGRIGGETARVVYAYAEVDESGLLPRVTQLSVHGLLPAGAGAISEYYAVSGGELQQ